MEEKKLDNLPPSKDKYWKDAEVEVIQPSEAKKCGHYFIHRTSIEVVCKCGVGYVLTPEMKVIDGHIYIEGKLVI